MFAMNGGSYLKMYAITEWVSNNLNTSFTARSSARSNTPYHQVQQSKPESSFMDVAEDAIAYYAIAGVRESS
jgi:hypothetical protein